MIDFDVTPEEAQEILDMSARIVCGPWVKGNESEVYEQLKVELLKQLGLIESDDLTAMAADGTMAASLLAELPDMDVSRTNRYADEIWQRIFGYEFRPPESTFAVRIGSSLENELYDPEPLLAEIRVTKKRGRMELAATYRTDQPSLLNIAVLQRCVNCEERAASLTDMTVSLIGSSEKGWHLPSYPLDPSTCWRYLRRAYVAGLLAPRQCGCLGEMSSDDDEIEP